MSLRTRTNSLPSKPGVYERFHYLDNFRTYLTSLVIIGHASLAYGATGTWPYTSPHHPRASAPLRIFNIINQTYFMAAFFLLSGYFSSISAAKKKRREWVWGKAKRLGIVTAVYSVFVDAGIKAGVDIWRTGATVTEGWDMYLNRVTSVGGVRGPVWYCGLLLTFDLIYSVLRPQDFDTLKTSKRVVHGKKATKEATEDPKTVRTKSVLLAVALTSVSSFFIRLLHPVGAHFKPLNLNPGYVPQYALFYSTGILAHRYLHTDLYVVITRRTRLALLLLSLGITGAVLLALKSYLQSPGTAFRDVFLLARGGWNQFAVLYTGWNEVTGVLITSMLLDLFKTRNWGGMKWRLGGMDVARYSYPAFLVHVAVVVTIQCLVDEWKAEPVMKTGVVGLVAVPASWAIGWTLVKVLEVLGIRGFI